MESVYEEALCIELAIRSIPFARQVAAVAVRKEREVGQARLDLLVDARLVVELKTVDAVAPIHVAQRLSYLKITRRQLGVADQFSISQSYALVFERRILS